MEYASFIISLLSAFGLLLSHVNQKKQNELLQQQIDQVQKINEPYNQYTNCLDGIRDAVFDVAKAVLNTNSKETPSH